MIEIASSKNPQVKFLKSLHQKKHRERESKFIVEGIKTLELAIKAGITCYGVYLTEKGLESLRSQLPELFEKVNRVHLISEAVLKEVTSTETPQGVIGVLEMPLKMKQEQLFDRIQIETRMGSILMLDRIQDPGNMGTIIRTAEAAGIQDIVLVKGCVDIFNDKVMRSTMGSIFNVSFYEVEDPVAFVTALSEFGYLIVASALENAVAYSRNSVFSKRNCLIIGNEGNGISDMLLQASDIRVKIPIRGVAESLNAGVAAGILIYKMLESDLNL
ncbi:TrmH family RNA methyltransferase [Fusibacter tunisiensis]|uniref:TrmH family RNA methyltransferase n=1 Tax=Fusibacter tunisiensis TaxID=1008308 RepID=A0ABS2MS88_9FIRM|nr:TrmH family RNA methyltransferase [Fusibacter tunisiensis]